jgi:dCTP diphosphatase
MGEKRASQMDDLVESVRRFAADRDWDQFHSPRNLVLALVGEVGELAAELQWIPDAEVVERLADPKAKSDVAAELADVLNYLLRLADVLEIDLAEALIKKIAINETRYPVDKVRGSSAKYTAYE